MTKHREILNFISILRQAHPEMERIFSNGACFYLYLLLKKAYPEAVAYYDNNHVITKIGNKYYDITGSVECKNSILLTEYYCKKRTSRLVVELMETD